MPDQLTGRALDAWLAEHAMGWKQEHDGFGGVGWNGCRIPGGGGFRCFSPSTDPRAAFELVEAMCEREWVLDLYSPRTGADAWEAAFQNRRCGESAEADTPCLAIALAAHAALGGE